MKIKCVILDWGGVCDPKSAIDILLDYISKKYKIPLKNAKEIWDAHNMDYLLGKEEGKIFWKRYFKELGIPMTYRDVKKFFREGGADQRILNIAKALKEKYTTILLSDNFKERTDFIKKRYNLKEIFDICIFSNEVGLKKPQREIFELVLKKAKCLPQECIYFDDLQKNVEEANKLGIVAIKFISYEKLKEELELRRVL